MNMKSKSALTVLALIIAGGAAAYADDHERGHGPKFKKHFMAEMMTELDTNEDGKLSQDEVIAGRTAKFQEADANADGLLSFVELEEFHEAEKEKRKKERKQKHFEKMDANSDGFTNLDEFLSGASDRFEKMDRNGDGFISKDDHKGKKRPVED
jgi:Ca2+-binding EF-hand superfamily protein